MLIESNTYSPPQERDMDTYSYDPYADGTSGHSGSDTSRERAEREDSQGITGWRNLQVFRHLEEKGRIGATVAEVEDWFSIGHGAASGALTRLHRAGRIYRLKERRKRQEVYVAPGYEAGRELSDYRPNGASRAERIAELEDRLLAEHAVNRGLSERIERLEAENERLRNRLF